MVFGLTVLLGFVLLRGDTKSLVARAGPPPCRQPTTLAQARDLLRVPQAIQPEYGLAVQRLAELQIERGNLPVLIANLLRSGRFQEGAWGLREAGLSSLASALEEAIELDLRRGIEGQQRLQDGATGALRVDLGGGLQGVFKPLRSAELFCGECQVAAYRLSRRLGWNLVPVTVFREHNGVQGTIQVYLPGMASGAEVGLSMYPRINELPSGINLFLALINEDDSHHRNLLTNRERTRWVLIDQEKSFFVGDALAARRMQAAVIDAFGRSSNQLTSDLRGLLALTPEVVRSDLEGILAEDRIAATINRLLRMQNLIRQQQGQTGGR